MYKAIGNSVIVKILKKHSSLDLSAMKPSDIDSEAKAVVESLGTSCHLGLKVGHEIVVKPNTRPVIVEETKEYDLLLIPETSVAFVTNWTEEESSEV